MPNAAPRLPQFGQQIVLVQFANHLPLPHDVPTLTGSLRMMPLAFD